MDSITSQKGVFRLFQVRGVEIQAHVSLVILLVYLVFVISLRLPSFSNEIGINPADLALRPAAWGITIALGLLVSIVLHEFGHVLSAQSQGIRVKSITLMMLGGVSAMERMPEGRYSELRLALLGPAVSFALAGVLFALHSLTRSPNLLLLTAWLGYANLTLGVFNLLPAFPLDGGRALRSLLAARMGNLRATQTTVKIAKVFAAVLGIISLISFNILLMLIAFFIFTAADAELSAVLTQALVRGLTVGELTVRTEPVSEGALLQEVAARMLRTRTLVLPVRTLSSEPATIALTRFSSVPRERWDTTRVHDIMDPSHSTLDVTQSVAVALPELHASPTGVLPVTESGRVVGVLRRSDLIEMLQIRSVFAPQEPEAQRDKRAA